jgi:glyoxylase-like metal-dependent hydrolase (beta-lactamase superfamily II)
VVSSAGSLPTGKQFPREEQVSKFKLGLILALASAFIGSLTRTHDATAAQAGKAPEGPQTGKLEQVATGHYMYSTGARISGIIATDEGVVVIDSLSNEAMAKHEQQLIANTIQRPVKYLISPTFHGNYANGNVAYHDVIKIGHEDYKADLIEQMKADNMPAAQQALMLPHLTFRDRMTIQFGGKEIHIMHVGRGHTRGDAIVFVPQDRIVYMSEMFFDNRFPFMDDGSVAWINTIDTVLKLEADIFVPGQGPSMIAANPRSSRDQLLKARQVLVDFRDAVQKEIARGATEEQTVATVLLPQHSGLTGYDQQRQVMVRRMYRTLKGAL